MGTSILVTMIMEVSVTAAYFPTLSAVFIFEMLLKWILMSALFILGVFSYMKQRV